MRKKKILFVTPGTIYPMSAGCQMSMFNQIMRLSRDHIVDVVAQVDDRSYFLPEKADKIKEICNNYYPMLAPHRKNIISRAFNKINFYYHKKMNYIPADLYYFTTGNHVEKVAEIANKGHYDIINSQYWFTCTVYEKLNYRPYFTLDTHNINFQKFELTLNSKSDSPNSIDRVEKYRALELKYTGMNDAIVAVSEEDYQFLLKQFPDKVILKINSGRDIDSFLNFPKNSVPEKSILFYGGMGGRQNQVAFYRLFNRIFPKIKNLVPEAKLYVLGAKPPEDIKTLHNGKDIFILGYVEDIREWISKSSIKIIPLETGGGFRTRVVEVMAMGVPVIGTKNALDCMEMKNGEHGYISDDDEEIARYAVSLLNNKELRAKISAASQKFVKEKFTIDATYGTLSDYFLELE